MIQKPNIFKALFTDPFYRVEKRPKQSVFKALRMMLPTTLVAFNIYKCTFFLYFITSKFSDSPVKIIKKLECSQMSKLLPLKIVQKKKRIN